MWERSIYLYDVWFLNIDVNNKQERLAKKNVSTLKWLKICNIIIFKNKIWYSHHRKNNKIQTRFWLFKPCIVFWKNFKIKKIFPVKTFLVSKFSTKLRVRVSWAPSTSTHFVTNLIFFIKAHRDILKIVKVVRIFRPFKWTRLFRL